MAKKNKSKRNKEQDYFPSLYMMQDDYPVNKYDGMTMPTQNIQMAGNTSSPQLTGLQPDSYQAGVKYGTTPQLNKESLGSSFSENFKNMFSTEGLNVLGNAAASVGAGALGTLGGNLIAGGKSSGIGNTIGSLGNTIGSAAMAVNPLVGGVIMGGTSLLGGAFNAIGGVKLNKKRIAQAENEINAVKNFNADASNFDDLMSQINNAPTIAAFSQKDIGSNSLLNKGATKEYNRLNDMREFAEAWKKNSIANAATNLQQQQMNTLLQNHAAYGGLLDINNSYSDGGKIYIKPENRGKFTALKERTGKSATWFKEHGTPAQKKMATFALNSRKWKHDDGGPLSSLVKDINERSNADFVQRLLDPNRDYIQDWESDNIATHKLGWATDDKGAIVFPNVQRINGKLYDFTDPKNKRGEWDALDSAIQRGDTLRMSPSQAKEFTETYKKYYPKGATFKAFGGDLLTNGTVFSNNVIEVNNGGTHEESPYEGVQMGIDSQGIPNLVEEGEVIFNDYVFSNRIRVPDAVRNKYKLRGAKNMTFSDAAKKIQKASEERPNDPIANDTLNINLTRLANEQEVMREQRNMNNKNKFKDGGKKYTKKQIGQLAWDAYNQMLTNPYIESTTGFGEGLDVNPNLAAKREQAFRDIQSRYKDDNLIDRDNLLRYIPAFGSALGVGHGLLSKPNYSRADALAQFAQNAGKITPISYDPLGNYLTYRPVDMNYIANRMAAQAGATRRNIMNTSGGNRANAIGSLLAADYNSQIAQADALRQGEDTNWNRLMQTETFNRGTNQYNSEAALKAAMANQEARMKASQLGLSGYTNAMQMKDAIDAQRAKTLSANLTNLFESLGQIGEEQFDRNRLKWLERKGVLRSDYFDTDKYNRNNKKTKG